MIIDVWPYLPHAPGSPLMMGKADQPVKSTIITISAAAAIAVLTLAGCGSLPAHQAAAPTVTHTVIQSQTPAPAPTVTITQSATPAVPSQPPAGAGANQVCHHPAGRDRHPEHAGLHHAGQLASVLVLPGRLRRHIQLRSL